jgi:hypothetical protein
MLTCVSGIITICVLYAMVVKKIYKQRKKFSKNNRRSDSIKGIQITKEMSTTDSEIASDTRAMNSDSSLKQQSADKHVAPLGHIILIPSQSVCSFSLMLRAERRSNKYQFYSL